MKPARRRFCRFCFIFKPYFPRCFFPFVEQHPQQSAAGNHHQADPQRHIAAVPGLGAFYLLRRLALLFGLAGSVGSAGSAGSVGVVGSVGPAGSVGSVGVVGSVGSVGSVGFSLVSNGVLEPRIAYWLKWSFQTRGSLLPPPRQSVPMVAQIHRLIVFVAFQVVVQRDFHRHGIVLDFKGFPILADADVVNGQQARSSSFSSGRLSSTLSCAIVSAERVASSGTPSVRRWKRWCRSWSVR